MRELKFRAWNKDTNTMVKDYLTIEVERYSANCGNPRTYTSLQHYNQSYIEDLIPMQYTGRKDKNGKEIYEGDICKFRLSTRYGFIDKTGVIRCEDLASGCTLKFLPFELDGCRLDFEVLDLEVIGNIYENKELLNAKPE
jgi:uncharacterized phage protein (TIGR01671 family)